MLASGILFGPDLGAAYVQNSLYSMAAMGGCQEKDLLSTPKRSQNLQSGLEVCLSIQSAASFLIRVGSELCLEDPRDMSW